jgi:Lar family restriction alleviation protein
MSEFKPCPFCGGTDIRAESHPAHRSSTAVVWSMCCYTCGATFPSRYRKELLIAAWNRRPEDKSDGTKRVGIIKWGKPYDCVSSIYMLPDLKGREYT